MRRFVSGLGSPSTMSGAVSAALITLLLLVVMGTLGSCSTGNEQPNEAVSRQVQMSNRLAMVQTQIAARGIADSRVLEAMRAVPRHDFVPPGQISRAYGDRALPIGEGQTISQPYIVALMTELLDLQPGETVLEVGTGSG